MRDVLGFIASRRRILDSRPALRPSWVAFAVANYIGEEYGVAFDVVTKYNESVKERAERYEESEFLLFQNKCLEKQSKYLEAIEHLEINESAIVDKMGWKTKMAEFLTLCGKFSEGRELWLSLLLSQTENYDFHRGYQVAVLELSSELCTEMFALKHLETPATSLTLSAEQFATLKGAYDIENLRSSRATKKVLLTLTTGEEFRVLIESHCIKCIREGIPALHHDVCSLIRVTNHKKPTQRILATDPIDFRTNAVTIAVLDLITNFVHNLKANGTFVDDPHADIEVPSCLLWCQFLRCHLLEMSGLLAEALDVIEECIAHTPTALDMFVKKARILKKCGDEFEAANVMEHVRGLDLQDRYLNNKSTKYLLRADRIEEAMNTIAMFTKHDGDPQHTLFELQCNWYELEAGEAYARARQWGPALKKFTAVRQHFFDYVDEMFDFHHFSMRKVVNTC